MNELFVNTWQNTGMKNQPIWVFKTEEPNGKLGNRVGDYVALSADMQRIYHLRYNATAVDFCGFVYYAESEVCYEDGNTPEYMCRYFISSCEEIFNYGRNRIHFKEIAENMIAMSERLGFGWVMEERYDSNEHSEYWMVYSKEFAERANIGKNVIYCFSKESIEEVLNEYPGAACDMLIHNIIMEYPDGAYEEDEAYVVIIPTTH